MVCHIAERFKVGLIEKGSFGNLRKNSKQNFYLLKMDCFYQKKPSAELLLRRFHFVKRILDYTKYF